MSDMLTNKQMDEAVEAVYVHDQALIADHFQRIADSIDFLEEEPVYTFETTIAFPAKIGDQQVTCEISEEALQDHFGSTSRHVAELIVAFKANRTAIEKVARRKYSPSMARWLLRSGDF